MLPLGLIMGFLLLGSVSCTKSIEPEFSTDTGTPSLPKRPPQSQAVDVEEVAGGMVSPIGLVAFPDATGRLAVIDQAGYIWIIEADGDRIATPYMDVKNRLVTLRDFYDERGLLGLAFHPDYVSNGKFYIYYTLPPNPGGPAPGTTWNNLSRIAEFRVSTSNPNMADLSTERVLFDIDDAQSNHNGGTIAFGPDGYLYIALGDGGGANDVGINHVSDWYTVNAGGNGQDVRMNLFGSILRVNVNGNPYSIPPDNPFVNRDGMDEIWAYGFRNPFRFSFDMSGSKQLLAGDAGQLLYEEVSLVKKGGNYGWNVKEGRHCFNTDNSLQPRPSCPGVDEFGNPLIDPVIEINNWQNPDGGRATTIIGGNVYRGHSIPGMHGKYIFGTFSQSPTTADGELFVANPAGYGAWQFQELHLQSSPNDVGYYLKGFGQDLQGEIYLTVSSLLGPSGNTGKVLKLVSAN